MGFFFKNKKKNKEEETVTPVVETTPEVPAKEGMILVREGIKLGLPTVSMEEAIVAAGELLRDLGYVDELKARMDSLKQRAEELRSKYEKMAKLPTFTSRRILRAFPKMMPREHVREFGQLRRILKKKRDEHLEILGQITEADRRRNSGRIKEDDGR